MLDPFALLGLPRAFALDPRVIEQRFRDLSRAHHPDRFPDATPADRRVAAERTVALNEAFRALRDPMSRALALLAAAGRPLEETARAEPSLLLEIMELREAVDDARASGASAEPLLARVPARIEEEERTLRAHFADASEDPATLDRPSHAGVRLKYLYRLPHEPDPPDE